MDLKESPEEQKLMDNGEGSMARLNKTQQEVFASLLWSFAGMRGLSNLTDSGRPQIDNYRIEVGSNQDE
jgi:hypothetical protein